MGRKAGWHNARSDSALRANREDRGGRVLKAWRRVDEEHTGLIGGALMELMHSQDIPAVRLATKLDAFIFDPRLMPRNFNDGFLSGYQFGRVVSEIKNNDQIEDDGYSVGLGEIDFLPNGRTIVAGLDSERLRSERTAIYAILGTAGVRGFTANGQRKQHRGPGSPTIVLGNLVQPVAKSERENILEVITVGIEHNLISGNQGLDISLGQLEVKAHQQD